jgi:hypothetical protein
MFLKVSHISIKRLPEGISKGKDWEGENCNSRLMSEVLRIFSLQGL